MVCSLCTDPPSHQHIEATANQHIEEMHDIAPFHRWQEAYIADEDERSPFFHQEKDRMYYTHAVYNYYIHPDWDAFGSSTLYMKVLYADYDEGFVIMELIGEWNDCLHNDVMYLKRKVVDLMIPEGIHKFILICENVLNFHGSDDCYYEEWQEEAMEEGGWICFVNTLQHVAEEMEDTRLQFFVYFGENFNDIEWRRQKPKWLMQTVEARVFRGMGQLRSG